MKQFIYIMKEHDDHVLIKHGYNLLKSDDKNCIWVFENHGDTEALSHLVNGHYVLSDVISL